MAEAAPLLDVKDLKASVVGTQILNGINLQVKKGEVHAIMGPNGIGKSTLLKIVMGETPADSGEVTWGYETHPGYFAQDIKSLLDDSKATAEEWLWGFCPGKDRGFVRVGERAGGLHGGWNRRGRDAGRVRPCVVRTGSFSASVSDFFVCKFFFRVSLLFVGPSATG